jgi:hypothetical protein
MGLHGLLQGQLYFTGNFKRIYLHVHYISVRRLILDAASAIEIVQVLMRGDEFVLLTGKDRERSDLATFCLLSIRM